MPLLHYFLVTIAKKKSFNDFFFAICYFDNVMTKSLIKEDT